MEVEHPAKFSNPIINRLQDIVEELLPPHLDPYQPLRALDPFAGTGKIHWLTRIKTVGLEIEPEWATMDPRTIVGNALLPPFRENSFDAIITSPTYGNRMADHHEAKDACSACGGTGEIHRRTDFDEFETEKCKKCKGRGLSVRNTYTHKLGRKLHPDNSGSIQWSDEELSPYKIFHRDVMTQMFHVLKPGGYVILNISDHIRKGEIQQVTEWWKLTLMVRSRFIRQDKIMTARNGMGANGQTRVPYESILVYRKQGA